MVEVSSGMANIHVRKVTAELIQYVVDGHPSNSTPEQFEAKYPAWMHGQPEAGKKFETLPHRRLLVTRRFF